MQLLNQISEFVGVGDYSNRRAVVELCNGVYSVTIFDGNISRKEIPLSGKSLRYAEDLAENYVVGIIDRENYGN